MRAAESYDGSGGSRIRARILYPFALVVLFVIAAFVVTTYVHEDLGHKKVLGENVAAVERLYRQGLEKDADMMHAVLSIIARDESIKKTFLEGDQKALLKQSWPLFNNLRNNHRVTHFYFSGPDRVNFLRVHQPNRSGDVINRITTLRAAQSGEEARGIEIGPLGTFTLRVVQPWYDGDRLIGFLELGEEINHITEEVHGILGVDLLVLVYEKFLDHQLWEKGRKMLGHQDEWSRYGPTLVVGRAMEKIPQILVDVLEKGKHPYRGVLDVADATRSLYVAFLPLNDVTGREVGDFVVVQDVTGYQVDFRTSMFLIAALSILVGSVVFAIFYTILGRVERDYRRQREVEMQLSRVNTEHQKIIQIEKLSAMGLMIGEIAHQLNNPLVGVVNMTQLAEREVDDPIRTRELLGEIRKAGKDCHAFVKRMLEFTKLSSFDRRQTNMNELIRETVSLFRESLGSRMEMVSDLPDNAPGLAIDPVLVRHAVFNLLSNAAQANPEGGEISIRLFAQTRERVAGWNIAIQDEGAGLGEGMVDKIFTPFFTTRAEGTGLGLPVVQHVAILHEGLISADNAEGGGAVFTLWLPTTNQIEDVE